MHRVVAYITAYKDALSLNQCLQAIWAQDYSVETVAIVDNSPARLAIECEAALKKIKVWHCPKNIGIAGGLNKAIPWASREGYDFIWLFDQDSRPEPNCLSCLLQAYESLSAEVAVGIVAPLTVDDRTLFTIQPVMFCRDGFREVDLSKFKQPQPCDAPITSGSLVCLQTFPQVLPPDARLLIDGVDLDYGLRMKRAGYQNFVVPEALLSHSFGEPTPVRFLGRSLYFQEYSAFRYYYICRNHTYLEMKFSRGGYRLTCGLKRLYFLIGRMVRLAIAAKEKKAQKMYACVRGTIDGLLGSIDQPF
ncbi:MAG: glycosyltransferase family 2 protein [Cyanobacteria bacterium P01_D01_bin.105]